MPHLLRTAVGFRSRHPSTVFRLGVVALTVWIAATAVGWLQAVGDVPAPAAVFLALIAATLTVCAVEIARRERERTTRTRERAAFQAEVVAAAARRDRTYVSSHALLDCNPITMEIPRQRPGDGASLSVAEMGQLFRLGAEDARNGRRRP